MKKKMYALAMLVLAVVVTSYSVSGTYAKYTSTVSGTDKAVVAKWDVEIDGTKITTMNENVSFNLFDNTKVYQLKDVTDFTAVGTDDENVKNGTSDAIVAPGTWGKVNLASISNKSDVSIHYAVTLAATKQELPLQYSLDGTTWKDSVADLSYNGDILVGGTDVDTKTLYWKWDFTRTDKDGEDTDLGKAGTATVELSLTINATQID